MLSAPNERDKIKVAHVVVSTNHVTFLNNRFPRLVSLLTSAIFVSGTSGIRAILKYRSVNRVYFFFIIYHLFSTIPIKESCLKRKPHCLHSGTKTGRKSSPNRLIDKYPDKRYHRVKRFIYTGAKLVGEKIVLPLKTTDRKSKPGWELKLKSLIKRQARILKRNIKKLKQKIKLEKTNQKYRWKKRD